jgi:hypothetical protein
MQNQKMNKRIKLIAVAMLSAFASYLLPWPDTGASAAQQRQYARPEIIGQETPYNERFGSDDGAAFAIHFSGDIHGNLEPCG